VCDLETSRMGAPYIYIYIYIYDISRPRVNWLHFLVSTSRRHVPVFLCTLLITNFRAKNLSYLRSWRRFRGLILLTISYESGFFSFILKCFQKIAPGFRNVCIVIGVVAFMLSLLVSSCSSSSGPPSDRKVKTLFAMPV